MKSSNSASASLKTAVGGKECNPRFNAGMRTMREVSLAVTPSTKKTIVGWIWRRSVNKKKFDALFLSLMLRSVLRQKLRSVLSTSDDVVPVVDPLGQ